MFENPRRGRQARNFTTNAPKILDLKLSSEQIFSRKLSLGAPDHPILRSKTDTLKTVIWLSNVPCNSSDPFFFLPIVFDKIVNYRKSRYESIITRNFVIDFYRHPIFVDSLVSIFIEYRNYRSL